MASSNGPRDSGLRVVSGGSQQDASSTAKPMPKAAITEPSVHYTCFVRLPFPRAGFVDPAQVEWSSSKDHALWKAISKANGRELDWDDLSASFDVSLPFLLQQAAWLYERHLARMKAQMKKLSPSANPSPIPPDSASNTSTPITGTFATASFGPRATSALSTRTRDSPTPTAGSGHSGMIKQAGASSIIASDPPFASYATTIPSRTPSTRTLTQSRLKAPSSPVPPNNRSFRSSFGGQRKVTPQVQQEEPAGYDSPPPAEFSDSESSSEDESTSQSMARSQAFRRPPHLGGHRRGSLNPYTDDADDDEDDESSGGFLPFATTNSVGKQEDVAATLRSPPPPRRTAERAGTAQGRTVVESSATSSESSVAAPARNQRPKAGADPASALSPRRRAELAGLSPRLRRDGSEGTPSMGSSFSDLDDASISQSALEDAYLSNMQGGSTASRMSTISQALRSRYL